MATDNKVLDKGGAVREGEELDAPEVVDEPVLVEA